MITSKTILKSFERKAKTPQRNNLHPLGQHIKTNTNRIQPMKETTIYDENIQQWLKELEYQIIANISKMNFTIDDLAIYMGMSKRKLYRLIHKHLGVTPHHYLKNYRLNYARKLLVTKKVQSVKAAAYSTGFPNTVYFSRQFKAEFGYLPSSLLNKI